ncbi:MAG: adenylate/guanylate cyclase domain-containing protein [Candidatus Limnocylindria bacterium]
MTAREDTQHAKLAAATPEPLAARLRAPRMAGERRTVTAVFADVVGSTALAETMDPEDWRAIVDEAFAVMSQTIYRYEGTIAQLLGDAILAFFGAPIAHEDDPERAVRCALDMVRAVDDLGVRVKRERAIELRIRAGLNTGAVVVGNVGSDLRFEYTAVGDAMNVAARMQSAARPGTVVITEATHRFVSALVDATDLGRLAVKGKSEPVHAYEVTGLKAAPGRIRGLAGLESPLVGREAPLAELRRLLEVVRAGRGRIACVLGEPGIGKSRLLSELGGWARGVEPRLAWVEGRCLSYGQSLPHHLVSELVRSLVGVSFSAGEAETREALERRLRDLLGDAWLDAYAYLGHLLSLELGPEATARLSGSEFEVVKRYIASLYQVLGAVSARGPVVLVCEDIHWADRSSVEVIGQILPLVNEMPFLFVATSRVERASPGWQLIASARELLGDALTEIRLSPLSAEDSRQLVGNLLDIESLPDAVRAFILAKAEGNPLFVEEVIRMLIDRGAIVQEGSRWVATTAVADTEIPATLQGLLLARIDRLPESSKRTLRVASVIGRQFAVRVLARLLGSAGP